jgi:hypothetical protein
MAAVQEKRAGDLYVSCFDSLLQFNSYLNRLRNQAGLVDQFYGASVDYEREVDILRTRFTSAMSLVGGEKTNMH